MSNVKRDALRAAVVEALAKLERRSQIVVTSGGVAVMGHLRGQPRTIANFCTTVIAVHDPQPGEVRAWCIELERELLEAN